MCCGILLTIAASVSLPRLSQRAVENGAKGVKEPWEESDEHGSVVMATVQTVCVIHHMYCSDATAMLTRPHAVWGYHSHLH